METPRTEKRQVNSGPGVFIGGDVNGRVEIRSYAEAGEQRRQADPAAPPKRQAPEKEAHDHEEGPGASLAMCAIGAVLCFSAVGWAADGEPLASGASQPGLIVRVLAAALLAVAGTALTLSAVSFLVEVLADLVERAAHATIASLSQGHRLSAVISARSARIWWAATSGAARLSTLSAAACALVPFLAGHAQTISQRSLDARGRANEARAAALESMAAQTRA